MDPNEAAGTALSVSEDVTSFSFLFWRILSLKLSDSIFMNSRGHKRPQAFFHREVNFVYRDVYLVLNNLKMYVLYPLLYNGVIFCLIFVMYFGTHSLPILYIKGQTVLNDLLTMCSVLETLLLLSHRLYVTRPVNSHADSTTLILWVNSWVTFLQVLIKLKDQPLFNLKNKRGQSLCFLHTWCCLLSIAIQHFVYRFQFLIIVCFFFSGMIH